MASDFRMEDYMGRATNRQDLLQSADTKFTALWALIDAMPEAQQNQVFSFSAEAGKEAHWGRDRNLRDVLVHLYEWHQLLLEWVGANTAGRPQPFLPEPYNWKSFGNMNVAFWEKHQATPYAEARQMLLASHRSVMALIGRFSDEVLFGQHQLPWTGTSTLGAYCVSATASHYEWAIKKVRLHRKTCVVKAIDTAP